MEKTRACLLCDKKMMLVETTKNKSGGIVEIYRCFNCNGNFTISG